jgi:hypothetical protein
VVTRLLQTLVVVAMVAAGCANHARRKTGAIAGL